MVAIAADTDSESSNLAVPIIIVIFLAVLVFSALAFCFGYRWYKSRQLTIKRQQQRLGNVFGSSMPGVGGERAQFINESIASRQDALKIRRSISHSIAASVREEARYDLQSRSRPSTPPMAVEAYQLVNQNPQRPLPTPPCHVSMRRSMSQPASLYDAYVPRPRSPIQSMQFPDSSYAGHAAVSRVEPVGKVASRPGTSPGQMRLVEPRPITPIRLVKPVSQPPSPFSLQAGLPFNGSELPQMSSKAMMGVSVSREMLEEALNIGGVGRPRRPNSPVTSATRSKLAQEMHASKDSLEKVIDLPQINKKEEDEEDEWQRYLSEVKGM